jgi:hypothetical protein
VVAITTADVAYEVDGTERRVPADTVVIAGEVSAGADLATQLNDEGFEVHVVGDAAEVAYIDGAIHSAWHTARNL